ncbi:MAG: class I SAM-dependent methyltransferase, partial [Chloroflexota bacterium]|nr:class I SAM-dependent methyltransferase [Chloroflexota bacterium]
VDASFGMLREARRRALDGGLSVPVLQAYAEALPVADAAYDRVMANHMLYHVPDQVRALREMRRVLRPGGRVIMATNAADHMARLHELHCQAAEALGYTPTTRVVDRFNLDNLPLVRSVFPDAERRILPNALIFPSVDGALQHYASGMIDALRERPPNDSHRPKLLRLVKARIEMIIEQEGVFRVPKDAGCFIAGA